MTYPPGNPQPGGGEPPPPGPKPPFHPLAAVADDRIFAAVGELRADLARGFRLPQRKAKPSFDAPVVPEEICGMPAAEALTKVASVLRAQSGRAGA